MAESEEKKRILIVGVDVPKGATAAEMKKTGERKLELSERERARLIGESFAEAMGTPEPERDLEMYRDVEEKGEKPFSIGPGSEPRFMVLYQRDKEEWLRQRRVWEIRGLFEQARVQKAVAGSVDSIANPIPEESGRLDPLGVEFKKEKLEFIYRNMPGLIAAKAVYTTIIGGQEFVGYTPGERKERRRLGMSEDVALRWIKEPLLQFQEEKLRKIYSEKEIENLRGEYYNLYFGTENEPACPKNLYGAKEPEVNALRKSIRFFLKTRGVDLLFVDEKDKEKVLYPGNDYEGMVETRTEGETVLERVSTRARDAEQVAWNFIFTTGVIESFNIPENNQYIREHHNKVLGPSNFMTLYLWMLIHPQRRFEAKVLDRDFNGGTDDAKENWSSLGSWAANNIQRGLWQQPEMDEKTGRQKMGWFKNLDLEGKPILDTDGNKTEVLRPVYKTVIPTFIRPDLVYDALREEQNVREALFDFLNKKGKGLLDNPENFTHKGLYNDIKMREEWEGLGESPFVNYRFDRLRWANVIYSVFKKGPEATGKIPLPDIAEAGRKLQLTLQEKMKLLIMLEGVNVNSPDITPAEGVVDWAFDFASMKRAQPDLFRESKTKREEL